MSEYKIMLIHPPGKAFQRGEDRCQSNVEMSTSTVLRACNDIGYLSSILKEDGFHTFLRDYPIERLSFDDFYRDFKEFNPDVLFLSTTNSTVFDDIKVANRIKHDALKVILKGAVFFDLPDAVLKQLDLKNIDCLVGVESDFIILDLINALIADNKEKLAVVGGIFFKDNSGVWEKNKTVLSCGDLNSIPFPDRSQMKNELYVRPDTNEPQATITTSRGCPSQCTYCMTPLISGKKVNFRAPENVLQELKECYHKYKIKNFFFRSDTFTIKKSWVIELCGLICKSELVNKIQWVANSRTRPIDLEVLQAMKKAGCWLVAFGFESGSDETMKKICKGATVQDSFRAVNLAKKAGLQVFGFYMIGFPWEKQSHFKETQKMIFQIDADFVELHIATPFYGTPLYKQIKEAGPDNQNVIGKDYFLDAMCCNIHISVEDILKIRKNILLKYHLRPLFLLKKILFCVKKPKVFLNYIKFGLKLFH